MRVVAIFLALMVITATLTFAQFKDQGLGFGAGFGAMLGKTDLQNEKAEYYTRAFLRYGLMQYVQGEVGIGIGRIKSDLYKTQLVPIDYRFLFSPLDHKKFNPYAYAGIGLLYYKYEQDPLYTPNADEDGFTGVVPLGVGMQYLLDDNLALEASGGYNLAFSDALNRSTANDASDAYWSFLVGFTAVGEAGSADADGDGLTNAQEKELGTNRRNPDTDGDGLTDGYEVNVSKTSPLKPDSDSDGLGDGDEVNIHKTNPNKPDSDGDTLGDNEEITTYKTDPNKADTDGDGLTDDAELKTMKTDPLKADTDGDGISDGDEVNKYKTDPLKVDTDAGTVNDNVEVERGTNPLDPTDDIPKPKVEVEVGQAIVLDGIVFETGKSDISPESEEVLTKAFNTLDGDKEIVVEIRGYTDNRGRKSLNKKLSQARADAVRDWLVAKGIAPERITAKGLGADDPVAPNDTEEGRQKNRRIEFFRAK